MSKAAMMEAFGGIENLELRDIDEPHAGAGQIRVRVTAAGLNPMDWIMTANDQVAARFGLTLPVGFGTDFAGVVDEIGEGVTAFKTGDRVFGAAVSRSVADHIVLNLNGSNNDDVHHTPDGLADNVAATLDIAARTAAVALDVFKPGAGDTVLIGGAAGGVGIFAVQLARLAGARVIGTGSESSFDFLRSLGAEPVTYGEGLAERVRALAPGGITAATDLYGTETVAAARKLGVPDSRISVIAAQVPGVRGVTGANAAPGTLERVAELVVAGKIIVPIAATYPVEQIQEAARFQATRHAHGKVVVTL
ncbi:MAG: NADP-dependent oxidoreductase [Chloroflexi bacterium]|nr:NADP-dependent oxidoreductase [Chloroflexota bacterium]OJV98302.1 MAG: NADPH:quinone reductase [Chloroflexi bacterium 54-19]